MSYAERLALRATGGAGAAQPTGRTDSPLAEHDQRLHGPLDLTVPAASFELEEAEEPSFETTDTSVLPGAVLPSVRTDSAVPRAEHEVHARVERASSLVVEQHVWHESKAKPVAENMRSVRAEPAHEVQRDAHGVRDERHVPPLETHFSREIVHSSAPTKAMPAPVASSESPPSPVQTRAQDPWRQLERWMQPNMQESAPLAPTATRQRSEARAAEPVPAPPNEAVSEVAPPAHTHIHIGRIQVEVVVLERKVKLPARAPTAPTGQAAQPARAAVRPAPTLPFGARQR